jgi:hypothetical protein
MKRKQTLNRRDFRELIDASGATLLVQDSIANDAQQIRVRYSIDSPNPTAQRNVRYYKEVVRFMKELPADNYKSWIKQAEIHFLYAQHENSFFLPWHRAYLYCFEQICRQILKDDLHKSDACDFALPYWDWSKSPSVPQVFWDKINNRWDDDLNVVEPPASWNLSLPSNWRWERTVKLEDKCEDVGQTVVDEILNGDFYAVTGINIFGRPYAGDLETGPHNLIHNFIGGNMANRPVSPLDPIFWLHHANVDRLWDQWTKMHEKLTPSPKCPAKGSVCCQQDEMICDWLLSEVKGFYEVDGKSAVKQVCNFLHTLDLFYKYEQSELINFEDCPKLRQIDLDNYSIETTFDKEKTAEANNFVKVAVSEFYIKKNLSNMQNSIAEIIADEVRLNSESTLPTLLLTIEVENPKNPAVSVRVFINAHSNPSKLSTESNSYVGTFSFFESIGAPHHSHGAGMRNKGKRFIFDLTDTIRKTDTFDLAKASVSICPKFLLGKSHNDSGKISLLSLRLIVASK